MVIKRCCEKKEIKRKINATMPTDKLRRVYANLRHANTIKKYLPNIS